MSTPLHCTPLYSFRFLSLRTWRATEPLDPSANRRTGLCLESLPIMTCSWKVPPCTKIGGAFRLVRKSSRDTILEALQRADALLAVTCTALTRDIYLELGFAAARGLRLLIVVPSRCRITYMITGLVDRGQAIVRRFESESQLAEIVNEEMPKLLPRAIDDRPPLGASGAAKLD